MIPPVKLGFEIKARGPLFDGRTERKVEYSLQATIKYLVEVGWRLLDSILQKRPRGVYLSVEQAEKGKESKGNYRAHLMMTTQGSRYGEIRDGGVIYGPWLEGISTRNQTTRFKGYSAFRRVAQVLRGHTTEYFNAFWRRYS